MLKPFSSTYLVKKAIILALFTLEILWNFQGNGLFGQSELQSAIEQKESISYPQALNSFRKLRASDAYKDPDFALKLENEMLEIFLALAEFDSVRKHLAYPAGWEDLDIVGREGLICQRYYWHAQFALQKKDYVDGSYYLNLTDSLAKVHFPSLLPKLKLRNVRLDIATGKFRSAGERLEALEEELESYDPVLKADFHFEKGFYHQLYKRFDISVVELGKALDLYQENLSPFASQNRIDLYLLVLYLSREV